MCDTAESRKVKVEIVKISIKMCHKNTNQMTKYSRTVPLLSTHTHTTYIYMASVGIFMILNKMQLSDLTEYTHREKIDLFLSAGETLCKRRK